jgi:hypothetical protein
MLTQYQADTQNFLNDAGAQFFRPETLTNYINRARRKIAAASGSIRVIPEGVQTNANQEEYKFSAWNALVQKTPGVREILAVRSLAVAIGWGPGAWKPFWNRLPYTDFAARFRIWNRAWVGTISYPGFYAQYSFGVTGSLFLAPIPSQAQPMDVDCSCMPFPLQSDSDPEALVYPWTDAVAYCSAAYCLMGQQRLQDAASMLQLFAAELPFAASVVSPQMVTNPYGAVLRSS